MSSLPAMSEDQVEIEFLPVSENRRTQARANVAYSSVLTLKDGSTMTARTTDLSKEGAGFNSTAGLAMGDECTLTLVMSVCGSTFELQMRARVCYSERSEGGYHSGLEFTHMDDHTRETLSGMFR
jgi:c-di-GMP-binding flagellar brake protein YcgR